MRYGADSRNARSLAVNQPGRQPAGPISHPAGAGATEGDSRKQGSGGAVRDMRGELSALVRQQRIKLAVKQSGPPKKDIGHVRGITGREVLR